MRKAYTPSQREGRCTIGRSEPVEAEYWGKRVLTEEAAKTIIRNGKPRCRVAPGQVPPSATVAKGIEKRYQEIKALANKGRAL